MRQFILKLLRFSSIAGIPLIIIGILYIVLDPFKVVYNYNSLHEEGAKAFVTLNKDYVSTTTFIKNNKSQNYNSFILGNSRSIFYEVSDWKKHLDQKDNCFHFDASGESLFAINKKINFIDKSGNNIKNVLLVLDYETLIQDQSKTSHLKIISPALVDNSNLLKFHKSFVSAFLLNPKFSYVFLDYTLSNQFKPYMKKWNVLDDRPANYTLSTNEFRYEYFEDLIKNNNYYTQERLSKFYSRDSTFQQFYPKCIFKNQKLMLTNMLSITEKHNTKIKVIINPLYNQLKLNRKDLNYLKNLFGNENVFDFSGINNITNNYKNYYESSHYRPHIAREIMNLIYK